MLCVRILLLVLLLQQRAFARPKTAPLMSPESALAAAQRQARFGDFSFLCRLLCESVEDTSEDSDCDWDYSFDGAVFCEGICNSPGASSTAKPAKTKAPFTKVPGSPTTTKMPSTAVTPNPTEKPISATQPSNPTTGLPSPTLAPTVPNLTTNPASTVPPSSVPSVSSNTATPTTVSPIISTASDSSTPAVSTVALSASTKDGTTTGKKEETSTMPSATSQSTTAATATSTTSSSSTEGSSATLSSSTEGTSTSDAGREAKDLSGSADELDIVTAAGPTTKESEGFPTSTSFSTSFSELDHSLAVEITTKTESEERLQELKKRLMPYMPELIHVWCEFRTVFPSNANSDVVAKLCKQHASSRNPNTAPPALFDFFAAAASQSL